MLEDSISKENRTNPDAPEFEKPFNFVPSAIGCSLQGGLLDDPVLLPPEVNPPVVISSKLIRSNF